MTSFGYLLRLERIGSIGYIDQKALITSPVPKYAGVIRCAVKRCNEGISGKLYPGYELYLEDTKRLLLSVKKRSGNWTGNYLITLDHQNLDTKSEGYVGKLRSNFWKSVFSIYDNGENPIRVINTSRPREHMGAILYVL